MKLLNTALSWYLNHQYKRIDKMLSNADSIQKQLLSKFVRYAENTAWGKKYNFKNIHSYQEFAANAPITNYEMLKPFIEKMMMGQSDILWKGKVSWFAKSSGTTSAKSKYIPVTEEKLYGCHIQGPREVMTLYNRQFPNHTLFEGNALIMGGSHSPFKQHHETNVGDVSAIMLEHTPFYGKYMISPNVEVAMLPNWDEKLEIMVRDAIPRNVTNISGVPTWTLVLLRRVLEITGKKNILEVWPNFQLYAHAGVNFEPYRKQFEQLFPSKQVQFWQAYNASEGFFAAQIEKDADDMLLLVNNEVFYEFLPEEEWDKTDPKAIPLWEVEVNKTYAIVITTSAGLWRYQPGDTIRFTSTKPYKIKVTGRTKYFINAFGEEVVIENTDEALRRVCDKHNAIIKDYTVAPIYFEEGEKGGHEWIIEFEKTPLNTAVFKTDLDKTLQSLNSDYEAKRYKDMAMEELVLHVAPDGLFNQWLKSKGKQGGQYKIPRLMNERRVIEEILLLLK